MQLMVNFKDGDISVAHLFWNMLKTVGLCAVQEMDLIFANLDAMF